MAVSVQIRNGRAQVRVTSPLLPRPFFHTFDTELEARKYGKHLAELLARGIVPVELQPRRRGGARLDQRVVCAGGSRRGNGLHDGVSS